MSSGESTYEVVLPDGTRRDWIRPFRSDGLTPDCRYFGEMALEIDQRLKYRGLRFIFTWDVERLPVEGSNVVAIVIGDEWSRKPKYAANVLAVYKTHGFAPDLRLGAMSPQTGIWWLLLLQSLRLAWKSGKYEALNFARLAAGKTQHMRTIPIGTYQAIDVDQVPMRERSYDVGFLGSIAHSESPRSLVRKVLQSPKEKARNDLRAAVLELKERRPDLKVLWGTTSSFAAASDCSPEEYSSLMSECKIVLCPRGTNPETFRYFEAHKFGCIVIHEPLPRRRFYNNLPEFEVGAWSGLTNVMNRLMPPGPRDEHQERLERLSAEARERWSTVLSPAAVGVAIADDLEQLLDLAGGES